MNRLLEVITAIFFVLTLTTPVKAAITVTLADENGNATLNPNPFYLKRVKFQVRLALDGDSISAKNLNGTISYPEAWMDVVEMNIDNTLIDDWDVFVYNVIPGLATGEGSIKFSGADQNSLVTSAGILLWGVLDLTDMPIGATPRMYLEGKVGNTKYSDDMKVNFSFYYGDANFNGIVSPYDAALTAQHAIELVDLQEKGRAGTDVIDTDSDGLIDSSDVLEILEEVANPAGHNFPVETAGKPPVPPPIPAPSGFISSSATVIDLSAAEPREGKWMSTLYVRNLPKGVVGGHIEIESLAPIKINKVDKGKILDKSFFVQARPSTSSLSLAFAQPEPYLDSGGVLAEIEFDSPFQDKFFLRVKKVLFEDIKGERVHIQAISRPFVRAIPSESLLFPNYPNPCNPETWIPFRLREEGEVAIGIFNIHGQLIRVFNLGYYGPGYYLTKKEAAYWDGRDNFGEKVASGIYFYQIQAGSFRATRKMVILK